MSKKVIQLFLRISLGAGFLSAVADRIGMWNKELSAWGNWDSFLVYTAHLLPWIPENFIPIIGIVATAAEIILGLFLIIGFKTPVVAKISGILLLAFALVMTFADSLKRPLDASVFTACAAAFSLAFIKESFLDVDSLSKPRKRK